METIKTLQEWEISQGVFVCDATATELTETMTAMEFLNLWQSRPHRGVNYEDRVKFLANNGYDNTRENLLNPELSARQVPGVVTGESTSQVNL